MMVTRGTGVLERFLSKKRAAVANRLIPRQSRKKEILDIGCGSTPYFLLNTRFRKKFGIDPNSAYKKEDIIIKKIDIENVPDMPFKPHSIEVATMLAVIEHFQPEKTSAILKNIHAILREGGSLIITTPCPWTDSLLRIMARLNLVSREEIDEHKAAYSPDDLARMLKGAGFRKISVGYFQLGLNGWAHAIK